MAQVTLPYTLTAGTPENVNNLMSNLTALRDGVNTIDTAQIANGAVTDVKLASAVGNFGAWTSWTPTLKQSGTVTATNTQSRYTQIGKVVFATAYLSITGSGTAGNNVILSLPVTAASASNPVVGSGFVYDSGPTAALYVCSAVLNSTTEIQFLPDGQNGFPWGSAPNIALANGDQIRVNLVYEA